MEKLEQENKNFKKRSCFKNRFVPEAMVFHYILFMHFFCMGIYLKLKLLRQIHS